jgi:hypothetical protein
MRRTMKVMAVTAGLALALAACGKGDGGLDGGGDAFSLRIQTAGGFLPPGMDIVAVPQFAVTSDGRVITSGPQIAIYPGPAMPNMLQRTISKAGIEALIAEARTAGLFGPDAHYDNPMVADAGTTFFIVHDGDARHQISAYALGGFDDDAASAEDKEARKKLNEFLTKTGDLESWLPDGALGEEEPYDFTAMRVVSQPGTDNPDDDLTQGEMDWPLGDLATFGTESGPIRCGVVTGDDLDELVPKVRAANQLTLWKSEGKTYNVMVRPQLPDETGCEVPSQPQG